MEFEDISPFLYDAGYGAFAGFIIGFTIKRVFKFLMLLSGLYVLSLMWLSSKGIIDVNWDMLFSFMQGYFASFETALRNTVKTVAFSTAFIGGFMLGIKV